MNVKVKTILNRIQPLNDFVYRDLRLEETAEGACVRITLDAHRQRAARCSICATPAPGYDREPERSWLFVPLWGLKVEWRYAPRRVSCPTHGVVVEALPWNDGKRTMCTAMLQFLGQWARRLSWQETARVFRVPWVTVCRAVEWMVDWGLTHRQLEGIHAVGIDEIHWRHGWHGASYLTVISQIDADQVRRVLWIGLRRTQRTLRAGLAALGEQVCAGVRLVCSDMWQPYRQVIARKWPHVTHLIDRFHVTLNLNQAVDTVRRQDMVSLKTGSRRRKSLKKMRWTLLRRHTRVLGKARQRLETLIRGCSRTARAYVLKESFVHFWSYRSVTWARNFLNAWITRTLKSRLKPMIKIAKTLREHEDLILNWIRCRHDLCTGAIEGLNNKIRVVTKRAYGYRTYRVMELALYHTLGHLPDPPSTHEFW
jgi:transposase